MQTRTRPKWLTGVLVGLLILLLLVGGVLASGGVELPKTVVSSGGGMVSNSGLVLSASLGQPVAGTVETGTLRHCSGFWCAAAAAVPPLENSVFLPLTIK